MIVRDPHVQSVVTAVEVAHAMRDPVRALVAIDLVMDLRDRGLVSIAAGKEVVVDSSTTKRIHARFAGPCAACGRVIARDTPCLWDGRAKRITHVNCAEAR